MREAFGPLRVEDTTDKKKKDTLEMLIFLKDKRDGTIKAQGCADRRKQRKKYDNAEATSPTVSTEAVLISAVIDAYKERDVAVVDISGAYLSADMDNDMFVIFRGTMA